MSILVNIKQNPNNLKKIGLKFIKARTAFENLYFGVPDEVYCYEEYTGGEDLRNQLLILFNRTRYGRGMSFQLDNDYNIELVLNFPATQTDIDDFYRFIKNFCENFKFETFFQEGVEYKLDQIESLKKEAESANKYHIKNNIKEGLTIFGCIYPITLEKEFIDKVKTLNENQAAQYFESYLDRKQKVDCYFAKPLIYKKNNEKYFARYALTETVPSILPLKNYLPFGYNQNLLKDIDEWNIAIIENKNNQLKIATEIPFDDFYKMLDIKKLPAFDEKHIIVTINDELLKKAENYKIEKSKKDLEVWLEDIRELGHKPFKIEYTNNFEDEKGVKCYIFKYKKSMLSKWFLGIVSDIGIFSKINEEYKKDTEITDAKSTLKLLSEIREKYKK